MEPKSGTRSTRRKGPKTPEAAPTKSTPSAKSAPSAIVIGHNIMVFAAQAIIGIETTKTGKAGLSEQLWEGLKTHRSALYADEVGKQFDEWLASTATDDVRIKCAKWRSGGYLANMLKNCRRIAEYALTDPSVWGCTSFGEAHKRANQKAKAEAGSEATGGGKVEYLPEEYILQMAIDLDAMTADVRSQVLTGMRRLMIQWGALDVSSAVDTVEKVA